jgi:hypothetical protein
MAAVALLGFPAGFASAYYVEITVDLTKQDKVKGEAPQGGNNTGLVNPNGGGGARGAPQIGPQPQGGALGGRGMLGGFNQESTKAPVDPNSLARVVIEVSSVSKPQPAGRNLYCYPIKHRWGQSYVVYPSELIPKFVIKKVDTVETQYKAKRRELLKGGKGNKEDLLQLAEWILKHGVRKQMEEYHKVMDEVAKLAPQDPAVLAYRKVSAAMKARLTGDEPSAKWLKDRLTQGYETLQSDEGHYTLVTNHGNKEEVKRRLKRLEDTYHTFFYWFALKGVVLQPPRYRLVAVLFSTPSDFTDNHQIYYRDPLVSAGFTARRDNVAVFSTKPLDGIYGQLAKVNQEVLGAADRKKLLKGTDRLPSSFELANKQVLALVQAGLDLEAERTSTTHEGVRQLLAVTALPTADAETAPVPLLARGLLGPEWLKFGLASFFETAQGAYWTGGAVPSWNYLLEFKFADEDKKLSEMGPVLDRVITDQYFREAGRDRGKLKFARTVSWALTYYLANEHLDKLLVYLQRLSKLPRDMEMDGEVLKAIFTQTFIGDPAKATQFANKWRHYIRNLKFEVSSLYNEARTARKAYKDALKAFEDSEKNGGGNQGNMRPPFGGAGGLRPPPNQGSMRPPIGPRPNNGKP